MDQEFAILFYYISFLIMTAWALNMYSNKLLNESRLNPVPEGLVKQYDITEEQDENENVSDEDDNQHSSEAESQEIEWGGEPQEGSHAHKRPERIAIARFHGEHED